VGGNGGVNSVCEGGAVRVVGDGDDAGMVRYGGVEAVECQDDAAEFDGDRGNPGALGNFQPFSRSRSLRRRNAFPGA
jgi:hypothetical protein